MGMSCPVNLLQGLSQFSTEKHTSPFNPSFCILEVSNLYSYEGVLTITENSKPDLSKRNIYIYKLEMLFPPCSGSQCKSFGSSFWSRSRLWLLLHRWHLSQHTKPTMERSASDESSWQSHCPKPKIVISSPKSCLHSRIKCFNP